MLASTCKKETLGGVAHPGSHSSERGADRAGPRWSASGWGVKEVGTQASRKHLISYRACCVPGTSYISPLSPGSYPQDGLSSTFY